MTPPLRLTCTTFTWLAKHIGQIVVVIKVVQKLRQVGQIMVLRRPQVSLLAASGNETGWSATAKHASSETTFTMNASGNIS